MIETDTNDNKKEEETEIEKQIIVYINTVWSCWLKS